MIRNLHGVRVVKEELLGVFSVGVLEHASLAKGKERQESSGKTPECVTFTSLWGWLYILGTFLGHGICIWIARLAGTAAPKGEQQQQHDHRTQSMTK